MKKSKLILFQLLTFILSINLLYKYFFNGFVNSDEIEFIKNSIIPLIFIGTSFIVNLLISTSYLQTRILKRKNVLKISIILLIIQAMYFIYLLIVYQETIDIIILVIYIFLILINYFILKELYNLSRQLFLKKYE